MTVRKSTVARKATPKVTVPDMGMGDSGHAQVIFTEDNCPWCTMPLLGVERTGENNTIIQRDAAAVTLKAESIADAAGCAFCAPDNNWGAFTSPAALLRFTDAFGKTDAVMAARLLLSQSTHADMKAARDIVFNAIKAERAVFPVNGKVAAVRKSLSDIRAERAVTA